MTKEKQYHGRITIDYNKTIPSEREFKDFIQIDYDSMYFNTTLNNESLKDYHMNIEMFFGRSYLVIDPYDFILRRIEVFLVEIPVEEGIIDYTWENRTHYQLSFQKSILNAYKKETGKDFKLSPPNYYALFFDTEVRTIMVDNTRNLAVIALQQLKREFSLKDYGLLQLSENCKCITNDEHIIFGFMFKGIELKKSFGLRVFGKGRQWLFLSKSTY